MKQHKPRRTASRGRVKPDRAPTRSGSSGKNSLVVPEDEFLAALESPDIQATLEQIRRERAAGAFRAL